METYLKALPFPSYHGDLVVTSLDEVKRCSDTQANPPLLESIEDVQAAIN